MIELLVAIGVIAALSTIALTVINPLQARNKTIDGVNMSKLADAGEALEIFRLAEGHPPASNTTTWNPFDSADAVALAQYIKEWPTGGEYSYYNLVEGSEEFICISVKSKAAPSGDACPYFKFITPYSFNFTGGNKECAGVVLRCKTPCTDYNLTNDFGDCEMLSGKTCHTDSSINACN